MEISELQAIHRMSIKAQKPLHLGYKKPGGRTAYGYLDFEKEHFRVYFKDQYTNYFKPIYDMSKIDEKYKISQIYVILIKSDTKNTTYVKVEDVFMQSVEKMERIKILYGTN